MSKGKITASVDDGHPLDLKTAEIFLKKGIKAIFYIPIKNVEGLPTLKKKEIRYLSRHFEIGGHTFSHSVLTRLNKEDAREEIVSGKKALEDIIGKEVLSFSPPQGKYNEKILKLIKTLGFKDLRSARTLCFEPPDRSKFLWHPNLHIYPHTLEKDIRDSLLSGDLYTAFRRLKLVSKDHLSLLDEFRKSAGPSHVWLHSWELEMYDLWKVIESL